MGFLGSYDVLVSYKTYGRIIADTYTNNGDQHILLKINHIKNVGRFYEVVPKGTPESNCTLERFNLLYADNGTGKTTFGAIIKSLAFNELERILSRKTIAGTGPCEASLQVDDQQCNFLHDVWKKSSV